jgi:hypothetical protein
MDRTIVCGDLHGCLDELQALLRACHYKPDCDRLVFVGDFLDRGPNPIGCLRLVRGLGAECVLGNHEEKFIRYRRHELRRARDPRYRNPVRSFDAEKLAQYVQMEEADFDFMEAWPLYLELGRYGDDDYVVVHAGFEPGKPLHKQEASHAVRIRWVDANDRYVSMEPGNFKQPKGSVPWTDRWNGPFNVIYGHAVRSLGSPFVTGKLIPHGFRRCFGIDTGCVFGGRLTAMVLPGAQFVQVPARRAYAKLVLDAAA